MGDKDIDLGRAVELVLQAIAERGEDFRHRDDPLNNGVAQCANVFYDNTKRTWRPGCVVGHALVNFGVKPITFPELDIQFSSWGYSFAVLREEKLLGDVSSAAYRYLYEIQHLQDFGAAWGNAHASALEDILGKVADGILRLTPSENEWLSVRG